MQQGTCGRVAFAIVLLIATCFSGHAFQGISNRAHRRPNSISPHSTLPLRRNAANSAIQAVPTTMIGSILSPIGLELGGLSVGQKVLFVGVFCAGFVMGRLRPFWKRYTAVHEIDGSRFGPNTRALSGRAVRISDGDTIRFLHTPTPFHPKGLRKGEYASKVALPIRICTIDTPETAKFGKKGQPFAVEAKERLGELLGSKSIKARLLRKDQYGRAVAQVFVRKFPWRRQHVDETLLTDGLAEVYTGGGAVYGPKGVDAYMELQSAAEASKRGIWSLDQRESAAEYKKRTKGD